MAYPDTVVVNAEGELLVGLSDGQIVNAGSVRGPAGYSGERGAVGLRGEPGISCIAAFKAPSQDDGRENDSWIDCSSAEFAFYKRSGNGWNKVANLRQPAPDRRMGVSGGGGGSSSGGGGSGGSDVHVGPNQPAFPKEGDLWFDTDDSDGRLYVFANGSWQPVLPQPDLDGYAKIAYVDAKTDVLPYTLETDAVSGVAPFSSSAEIRLADAKGNVAEVKLTGTNGIGINADNDGINIDGSALTGEIDLELDNYATKAYSDNKDQNLQNQIDDLEIQKGSAANYDCKSVAGSYNARSGEISFDNETASSATVMGLGVEDKSGTLTKTIDVGDIIEIVGPSGVDTRFRVTNIGGAPLYISIEFVSGDQSFVLDQQYTVYIYPQNEAGATKEYVDAQDALKVNRSGDTMKRLTVDNGSSFDTAFEVKKFVAPGERETGLTIGADGKVISQSLIKSNRDSGYAFEVNPGDAKTTGYWHSSGAMRLYPAVTGTDYCFAVYATGLGDDKVAFRVTADGSVKAGHDTSNPFIATAKNDVITKEYFDANAVTAKPAQLCWKYAGDKGTTAETPSSGYFNKSESSGKIYLRFAYESFNGVHLGDGKFADTNTNMQYGPVGTIWALMSNGRWKLRRQFRADTWRWNYIPSGSSSAHFEFGLSSSHGHDWGNMPTGNVHYITVGGFF